MTTPDGKQSQIPTSNEQCASSNRGDGSSPAPGLRDGHDHARDPECSERTVRPISNAPAGRRFTVDAAIWFANSWPKALLRAQGLYLQLLYYPNKPLVALTNENLPQKSGLVFRDCRIGGI